MLPMQAIHPTAIIDPSVQLPDEVTVGPFAVLEAGVVLGPGCKIGPHAVLRTGAQLGAHCLVDAHAVIAGDPQDLRFDGNISSFVILGDGVTVREGATVHRATSAGAATRIGNAAFIMAYAHIGHDCSVGNHAIIANNVMMAGNVHIGGHSFVGGGAAFHQFVRVGESVMISGMSRVARDAPPFTMVAERDELIGLNLVGIKRRQLPRASVLDVKLCYRAVFGKPGIPPRTAAANALQQGLGNTPEGQRFLQFFAHGQGQRGFVAPRVKGAVTDHD